MPNIATVLREEISRLSRREGRSQLSATKRATAQHRREIAALKRQIASLERQVRALAHVAAKAQPTRVPADADNTKLRFVAKGLRSHRARLDLSASAFGRLIGASANSVYAWESGKTIPQRDQIAKIAAVRAMGKREAIERLNTASRSKRKR